MYWKAIGVSVDQVFAHTYLYNGLYGRPIAPLGQTYQSPKSSELNRFRQLATAYGAPGVSWWSWQSTSAGGWRALGRALAPLTAIAQSVPPVAPRLARGARGDVVVWAQEHLLAAAQPVTVNGRYDTRTVRAVKAFQLASALPVTGILDVPTWQLLLAREPAAVTWRAGSKSGSPVLPVSAKMRPRMREIPPKPH